MKQPEKQVCRVCKVEIERTAEARGADWALCPLHLGMVTADERERRAVKEIADMLLLGRLMIARDAARAGWVTPVPPTAPKPHPVLYDDDGTPRYRDTASPHGVTVRPEVDTLLGGSDPRMNGYRVIVTDEPAGYEAKDDGE